MFDNQPNMSYNNSQNDVYDAVANHYLAQPQIVKMDEQRTINDPDCKHETLVPDPDDTIGDAVYHGCTNRQCGVGFYLRNKNLT